MKVSELIKKLSEVNSESEVVAVLDYIGGDYGEQNCELKAKIEDVFEYKNKLVLKGCDLL